MGWNLTMPEAPCLKHLFFADDSLGEGRCIELKQMFEMEVSNGRATGKGKVMEGVAARGRKRWSASEMGSFTVNVDTALKSGVGRAGCVIQEDIGALVAYASIPIFQLSDQKHAKVVDVLEGLKLAKDLGLKNVVLEMDCKALLEDVNIPDMDFSDLGREANNVAHVLASLKHISLPPQYWIEEMPDCILQILLLTQVSE
ncbi:hypothetical protein M9H77_19055 [Catharanthus roseus]|uniref:Uncharacterized protein n=1 Tax=Catharanthus roseus TaxID=4058 RepID=A0ACC0B9C3_CATRO|nr:hypothetical protein M9H77_19055 [Catharanthus roseus]